MRMLACCVLLSVLIACEQPALPPASATRAGSETVKREPPHKERQRQIDSMLLEIRRLRLLLERKDNRQ